MVDAIVEIVKENYLVSNVFSYITHLLLILKDVLNVSPSFSEQVLSLPAYNYSIGYASLTDYNTQRFPITQFSHGQR